MHCDENFAYHNLGHKTSKTEAQDKKLTTGEYCQLLREQYERLAQHQQVIEAEWRANKVH